MTDLSEMATKKRITNKLIPIMLELFVLSGQLADHFIKLILNSVKNDKGTSFLIYTRNYICVLFFF